MNVQIYNSRGSMKFIQCEKSNSAPPWKLWHFIKWQIPFESNHTGDVVLERYKLAWVKYNSDRIKHEAKENNFPSTLLAGVCWKEVGGDLILTDSLAHLARSFNYIGNDYIDSLIGITRRPEKTSFGPVQMQLRVAAKILDVDTNKLDYLKRNSLGRCLEIDKYNIRLVAKHLREIIDHDGLQKSKPTLSDEAFIIAATRYNRGLEISLESLKKDLDYGSKVFEAKNRLRKLINA